LSILLVEDDSEIARFLSRGLAAEGFTVDVVEDGGPALHAAREKAYSLVILDLMLPEIDGLTVCRALRAEQPSLMILMLTARDSRDDKVIGLRSGADDYLTKPFDFAELLARVEALLRRAGRGAAERDAETLGDLVIDRRRKVVTCGDRDLGLTATEFALFGHLADNLDQVLSREDIMRDVWRRSVRFETNLVDVYIRYLRRKLETAGSLVTIATVRGFGYTLGAPVAEDQATAPLITARAR
jgi:two-component system, OmpR family, response regulator